MEFSFREELEYFVYSINGLVVLACFWFGWPAAGIIATLFLAFWILVFTSAREAEEEEDAN